jgi:hypothetical protein
MSASGCGQPIPRRQCLLLARKRNQFSSPALCPEATLEFLRCGQPNWAKRPFNWEAYAEPALVVLNSRFRPSRVLKTMDPIFQNPVRRWEAIGFKAEREKQLKKPA